MTLYLGRLPLRSTATFAALPAMSLVPVRSIRAAIGARKMHSDLTTEFTKAIVGVLPIVFLIMVWAWYLRLSGSGLKTLSLDLFADDAPFELHAKSRRPKFQSMLVSSKRQPVRNADPRWCCGKQGEVPMPANPSGVAPDIRTAAELEPVDLRLELRQDAISFYCNIALRP